MYNQPFRVTILQTLFDLQGRLKINTKHTIPTWMPFLSKFLFSSWISKQNWSSTSPIGSPLRISSCPSLRAIMRKEDWSFTIAGADKIPKLWQKNNSPRKLTCRFWKMFTILWRISLWVPFEPASNMEWSFTRCSLASNFDHCSSKANAVFLPHHGTNFHERWNSQKRKKLATAVNTLWTGIFLAGQCTHLTNMEIFSGYRVSPRLYDSPRLAAVCWKKLLFLSLSKIGCFH